ncbi:hypothetical protein FCV25MIE_12629 [Fagus crenata]|jgi:hypothetical protein|uniref:Uncharacterized protein n=1 Tax=Fagus sylvatica TaxID=28930 RepID=A0A2N9EMZ4_FAGSY
MRSKAHQQNKFVRFITIPIRVLCKARDFYVRSITDCAPRVGHSSHPIGCTVMLPKSYSVSSSRSNDAEDLRELIRAASARTLADTIDMEMILNKQQGMGMGSKRLPKCSSVGMGKIDEDRPCDFGKDADGVNVKADLLYPRSRSYAVTKRSVVF